VEKELYHCEKCKKDTTDSSACEHCGYPNPKKMGKGIVQEIIKPSASFLSKVAKGISDHYKKLIFATLALVALLVVLGFDFEGEFRLPFISGSFSRSSPASSPYAYNSLVQIIATVVLVGIIFFVTYRAMKAKSLIYSDKIHRKISPSDIQQLNEDEELVDALSEATDIEYTEGLVIDGDILRSYNGTFNIVNIPPTVRVIAGKCFDNKMITDVQIPASVEFIGNEPKEDIPENTPVFLNCKELKTVTFSKNSKLRQVGSYAFCGCRKLGVINGLPKKDAIIKNFAFRECDSLNDATIEAIKKNKPESKWNK